MVVIFLREKVRLRHYRSVTHPVSVISRSVVREASISSTVLIVASGLLVVKIFDSCPSQPFMKCFKTLKDRDVETRSLVLSITYRNGTITSGIVAVVPEPSPTFVQHRRDV